MSKIKTLIIGCGKIAGIYENLEDKTVLSHCKALYLDPDYDLVSCCDIVQENAKKLADKYGFTEYGDDFNRQIKDNQIDVVSICTPDNTHFKVAKTVLENEYLPSVIFLEKPICANQKELYELISLSREKNVKIVVNHTRRYDNKHIQLKKLIKEGFFGKLYRADVYYYSGWEHNGVHVVDTLSFLFDEKIEISKLNRVIESPYPEDDTADFELLLKQSGAPIYLTGIDERYFQLFEFDLKFDKSRLRIEDFGNRLAYEKKYINEMHENVLKLANLNIKTGTKGPIQNAYTLIKNYIIHGENSLDGYSIEDVSNTMLLIWKGKQWIKRLI